MKEQEKDVQKIHQQEKKENQAKHKTKSKRTAFYKLLNEDIDKIFPEIEKLLESPDDTESTLSEKRKEIIDVLRFFSTHPKILKSIQQNILRP